MNRRTFESNVVGWVAARLLGAAILGIFLPVGAQAQSSTLSIPTSISADCSVDATSALNAFFAGVPDNSAVSFHAGSCYLVVGTVEVRGKNDVSIEGNGARLVRKELSPQELRYPNRNGFFRIVDGNRVRVSGLNVEGTNNGNDYGGRVLDANGADRVIDCPPEFAPQGYGCYSVAFEFEIAFEVLGSVDTEVSDVSVKDVWGDGVYVAGFDQFTSQQGTRVTLRNVTVDRNGRQGIAVNRISHVLIDGLHLTRGLRSGVDIEPDTSGEVISDIEIRNSTLETNLLAFASHGRGESSNVYIHDNVVTRTGVPWVYVSAYDGTQRSNWRIHNNDVRGALGSPQPGLFFVNVIDVDIRGNINHYAPLQPTNAVGLYDGSSATITCNWFEDAAALVVGDGTGSWTEQGNSITTTPPADGCTASETPEPEAAPSAPSDLQSTGFPDPRVDLSWTDNSGNEDAFEVLRRGPDDTSFNFLAYLGADTQGHQDYQVVAGQEYCYQVVAHNSAGSSSPSSIACATPGSAPEPPASPTNVQTVGTESPTVDVFWSDVSADEELFEIQRKGPGDAAFWAVGNVGRDVETFADRAVDGGLEYCYQVVAVNAMGSSDPSNTSCATTPNSGLPAASAPAAPEQLQAVSIPGEKQVDLRMDLSWIDASDNETGFEVHRRENNQKYRRIADLEANSSSFTDSRVREGRLYCYRLIARNAAGASVSNEACIATGPILGRIWQP